MTKRTYNPGDYSPETQAAMKEILGPQFDSSDWHRKDLLHVTDIADAIEKAVKMAKQVTEEEVRSGCAAVAVAHLNNSKTEV